jgi:hypothetical protein
MRNKPHEANAGEKQVVISLAVSVDETTSNEEIADRFQGAISSLGKAVHGASGVQVRTVPRLLGADPGSGGYETRLWEKVTCDFLDPQLENPGDPLELQEQIAQLSEAVAQLGTQVERLGDAAQR